MSFFCYIFCCVKIPNHRLFLTLLVIQIHSTLTSEYKNKSKSIGGHVTLKARWLTHLLRRANVIRAIRVPVLCRLPTYSIQLAADKSFFMSWLMDDGTPYTHWLVGFLNEVKRNCKIVMKCYIQSTERFTGTGAK